MPPHLIKLVKNCSWGKAWRQWLLVAALFVGVQPLLVLAGGGPQNVALIVNPNHPDSLAVANAYVTLRSIPGDNVIYIPWKPNVRAMTGAEFRDKLLKPVLEELKKRGLTDQIDVVAFSSGYPYYIHFNSEFAGHGLSPQTPPVTSLNGAMYLYQSVLAGDPAMFELNSNLYFAPTRNGRTESRVFSSQQGWADGGMPAASGGQKYLLSTALGVTFGRGNTAAEIIRYLQRDKTADGTRPRGTIYYMQNNNVRSQVRQNGFPEAIAELRALGVSAELGTGTAPINKPDVAGLTTGTSHLNLRASGSTLLPGALVDNLTSAAGQLLIPPPRVANPQTPISEYMRAGAGGASGTVVEPYAIPAKFPSPALHVHYARGMSLSESFYRSVQAPALLLILGDPLCQPWGVFPEVTVTGVSPAEPMSGVVELTPTAKYPDARTAQRFELFVDGLRRGAVDADKPFSLDTAALADGWHDVRVVAIDDTPTATQGAWTGALQVKNGRDAMQLTVANPRVSDAAKLQVDVTSTAKLDAVVLQNGRRLGVIKGGTGKLQIDGAVLGKGRVSLVGVQEQDGRPVVRSRAVAVEVY